MRRLLKVGPTDDGSRVDAFVARTVPEVSRRLAKSLARAGNIRCAGRVVPGSHGVRAGDCVDVLLPETQAPIERPSAQVLHQNERFLYLNKPPGVHTVRLRPDDPPTLADIARSLDPECESASPDPREAGALHRLDVSTSGIVAFARSSAAWHHGRGALSQAWKLYLARAEQPAPAWPPPTSAHVRRHADPPRWPAGVQFEVPREEGTLVTWPLSACGPRGRTVEVDEAGSPAASRIWPILPESPMFAVELLSGRRHQIRVHMASLGLPLAGDAMYGAASTGAQALLHAWAFQLEPAEPLVVAPAPAWSDP